MTIIIAYEYNDLPKNSPIYPPTFPIKEWMSTSLDCVITFISSGYFMKMVNDVNLYFPKSYLIFEIRWHGFEQCDVLDNVKTFAFPYVSLDVCVLLDRLHRGSEKLIELRNWNQSIPYFNRLDYVSIVAQEEIYCYTIEKLLLVRISSVCSVCRVIFLEISRIFNHLLAVVTHAIDVGAFSPFLWAFEEREKLIEF